MKAFAAVSALALVGSAQAHYYVKSINGNESCLRPISPPGKYIDNSPVTGGDISGAPIRCGQAEALVASPKTPCTLQAGSRVTLRYDSSVGHPGPEAIYVSKSASGPWTKINEDSKWCNNQWANDRFTGGTDYTFTLPSALPSGQYVMRTEHLGLHGAGTAGGAQFYIRCIDINVTGGGSGSLSPSVNFPGAYSGSTPGVQFNPYSGNNANYPNFGGALASWGTSQGCTSSGGGGNPPAQTTTQGNTQPPRTTTQNNGGGSGASLYGQCGGRSWTGPTTCAQGTCKVSNEYYSQCLP
ncbi:hypothetical protein HK097_001075 [Rhizophlyctis rosea]|uniref:lytic cellulose monooxygenase (C4-dehydrogenating) n=1 Tax=Rhizophlyctis rosea TaxID=64517 RepID=A0AAD5S721_9FUNG|nr:hypothetical protein HK097_001075 [Rhizophlyctis rosea]